MTTLLFIGNSYKYEMENVAKMFFPLAHFHFVYDGEKPESDYICFLKEETEEAVRLSVEVCLPEGRDRREAFFPKGAEDNACENELARQLFGMLREMTGLRPQWGILTGVRPVKLVQKRLEKGMTDEEIRQEMVREDLVSDRKLDLALKIAHVQKAVLADRSSRDYSLYLSIPYCPSRCSYCSFVSAAVTGKKAQELLPKYLMTLIKELRVTAELAQRQQLRLRSIYLGGGTPTVLSAQQLKQLTDAVQQYFPVGGIEYTIEAGRPDTITQEKLEVIRNSGATRISINPQTFSDRVLQGVGRKHTAQDVIDCYQMAREMGFTDINMDLIAGLPGDSYEGFCRSLDVAAELDPENITVHSLTVKRSSALYSQLSEMEDYRPVQRMMDYTEEKLMAAGYDPYYLYRQKNTVGNLENVGYAKPGHWGAYNIYIMEEVQTILACGAGAVSKVVLPGRLERVYNFKYPYEYISQFADILERKKTLEQFLEEIE
jgi:oxygen-independent coproporphyrinogen-3 oxidase